MNVYVSNTYMYMRENPHHIQNNKNAKNAPKIHKNHAHLLKLGYNYNIYEVYNIYASPNLSDITILQTIVDRYTILLY